MIEFPPEYHPALAAHDRHATRLLGLPHVVGVAVGRNADGDLAVRIFVTEAVTVPPQLDGVPTDVVDLRTLTGTPTPTGPAALRTRQRPAFGGCSLSSRIHPAGTLGAVCRTGREVFVLSANHVIASSNHVDRPNPVVQPGHGDGSTPDDVLGRLHQRVRLRFGADARAEPNRVDAAVARVEPAHVDWPVAEIGLVTGLDLAPRIGMTVRKTGRTTGLTTGTITDVHALMVVRVRELETVFQEQCIARIDVGAGDSGSLVVDEDGGAVGLLSTALVGFAVINPIGFVVDALGVTLTKP